MKHAYIPRTTTYNLNPGEELNDLRMSDEVRPLYEHVKKFIRETVDPMSVEFVRLGEDKTDRWSFTPEQLEVLQKAKDKAKEEGLWNFFLPDDETGEGLKNLDYAYIAVELGKNPLASETMNCSAPDTGNMEVLERVGTKAQKEKWLKPLLARRNPLGLRDDRAECRLVGRQEHLDHRKARRRRMGDQRREILHLRRRRSALQDHDRDGEDQSRCAAEQAAVADPGADRHARRRDHRARCTCSATTTRRAATCTCASTMCRVPKENMLLGEGRGFEISQVRLGPGRIHHCMRTIGKAEKALDLMVSRGLTREAFGKKIAHLGGNLQIIAQARCEIEAMRLMVLKAAKAMDVLGNKEARIWVSMVKAMVPERTCKIIDQAIQMHGATGISQWTPLGEMYQDVRHLRFADGPDEVHWMVVGRHELSMP